MTITSRCGPEKFAAEGNVRVAYVDIFQTLKDSGYPLKADFNR